MPKDDMKLLTNQIRKEKDFVDQAIGFITAKTGAKFNKVSKVSLKKLVGQNL